MDALSTQAVADERGNVHLHVGAPGTVVRVQVQATPSNRLFGEILDKIYGSCADLALERPEQGEVERRDPL